MKIHLLFIFLIIGYLIHCVNAQNNDKNNSNFTDSLLLELKKNSNDNKLNILLKLGENLMFSQTEQALGYLIEAKKLADSLGDLKNATKALRMKGQIEFNKNQYYLAQQTYLQEVRYAELLKDSIELGYALQNVGRAYDQQGDYSPALKYYFQALKIHEDIAELRGKIITLSLIGVTYKNQENYEDALKIHKKAFQEVQILKDKRQEAIILNNIGVALRNLRKFEEALDAHQKALHIDDSLNNVFGKSICYNCIGVVYKLMGKPYKALEFYDKGRVLSIKNNNKLGISISSLDMAEVYIDINQLEKANDLAINSLNMAKEIKAKRRIKEAALILSKISEKKGDFKMAYTYYQLYSNYKDSIFNEKNNQQIAEMKAKYESEKQQFEINALRKEKELQDEENKRQKYIKIGLIIIVAFLLIIAFLLYKNNLHKNKANRLLIIQKKEISEQKEQLLELNLLKNRLFSIISHDLMSPFNTLKGLLMLAKESAVSQEDLRNLLYEISKNFQHTLSLLENLLSWSKSQMEEESVNFMPISILEISKEAIALIEKKAEEKGIKIENNISSEIIAHADKDMISLVFRNLLNNAVKFCREGDSILLSATKEGSFYKICIKDTGVGISPDRIKKLFGIENSSTKGTANERGTGLGLILCHQFVSKNNGRIWVESDVGNGSSFYFTLPVNS